MSALISFHMKNGLTLDSQRGSLATMKPVNVKLLQMTLSSRMKTSRAINSTSAHVGEKACVFLMDKAFRLDGFIVSQNLGQSGLVYGFRAENHSNAVMMKAWEIYSVTMDGWVLHPHPLSISIQPYMVPSLTLITRSHEVLYPSHKLLQPFHTTPRSIVPLGQPPEETVAVKGGGKCVMM